MHSKIENRPGLIKILDNIGWLFFDKILRMGVGLLVGVWMARYLGPKQFGLLNFALAFVGLFGGIATLGLQGIMVRDIIKKPEESDTILGTGFLLRVVGGLVAFVLILAVISHLRPDDILAKTIVAILGFTQVLKASEVVKYWFESQVQSKFVVWVENSVFLITAGAKVAMILLKAPLIAFAWTTLTETALVAVCLFGVYSKQKKLLGSWNLKIRHAKRLLHDSWPLIFSGVMLMIQARIDQIMIGQIVGDIEVGYYSTALRIAETAGCFSMIISQSFLPNIIESKNISEYFYHKKLAKYYRIQFLFSIIMALPLLLFGKDIINFFFGLEYEPAGILLMLMSSRLFFTYMGVARSAFLLIENMLKFSLLTMVCGTTTNILINIILIPLYQGVGAIIATIISFMVTIFILDLFNKKTRFNIKLMFKSMFTLHRIFN